jgi:hypothetical protein
MLNAVKAIDKAMAGSGGQPDTQGARRSARRAERVPRSERRGRHRQTRQRRAPSGGRRSASDLEDMSQSLLDYVAKNPGQRGEQIAAALGTDVQDPCRPAAEEADRGAADQKTRGSGRGMEYFAT